MLSLANLDNLLKSASWSFWKSPAIGVVICVNWRCLSCSGYFYYSHLDDRLEPTWSASDRTEMVLLNDTPHYVHVIKLYYLPYRSKTAKVARWNCYFLWLLVIKFDAAVCDNWVSRKLYRRERQLLHRAEGPQYEGNESWLMLPRDHQKLYELARIAHMPLIFTNCCRSLLSIVCLEAFKIRQGLYLCVNQMTGYGLFCFRLPPGHMNLPKVLDNINFDQTLTNRLEMEFEIVGAGQFQLKSEYNMLLDSDEPFR